MEDIINCPFCNNPTNLSNQKRKFVYHKEVFEVNQYFYRCEKCNKEFTTIETDTNTISQVHNKYKKIKKI